MALMLGVSHHIAQIGDSGRITADSETLRWPTESYRYL
jgi:hypothetical protein